MTPPRYVQQQEQEWSSRDQLRERFGRVGLLPAVPDPDLGEDFIFSIYHGGNATGVNFYVQLKSITDLQDRKRGDYLSYEFKVKDLKHWEGFASAVVLMIWDIRLREGRWMLARDACAALDRRRPDWRAQKTATVRIPFENGTSDPDLATLRLRVGLQAFPLISRGRELRMGLTLRFEAEDKESQAQYERFQRRGESATIPGTVIQGITFPDWFRPFTDGWDVSKAILQVGPIASTSSHRVGFDFANREGDSVSLPPTEMVVEQIGSQYARLTNEGQRHPLNVMLTFDKTAARWSASFSFRSGYQPYNVIEELLLLRFLCMVSGGATSTLTFLDLPEAHMTAIVPPMPDLVVDQEYLEFVKKLCFIQNRMGVRLRIPEDGVSVEDKVAADALYEIASTGAIRSIGEVLNLDLDVGVIDALGPDDFNPEATIRGALPGKQSHYTLFGEKIDTGPFTIEFSGTLGSLVTELVRIRNSPPESGTFRLTLRGVELLKKFHDWMPSSSTSTCSCGSSPF